MRVFVLWAYFSFCMPRNRPRRCQGRIYHHWETVQDRSEEFPSSVANSSKQESDDWCFYQEWSAWTKEDIHLRILKFRALVLQEQVVDARSFSIKALFCASSTDNWGSEYFASSLNNSTNQTVKAGKHWPRHRGGKYKLALTVSNVLIKRLGRNSSFRQTSLFIHGLICLIIFVSRRSYDMNVYLLLRIIMYLLFVLHSYVRTRTMVY